jgi:rhodanese-related sulfurtransferase
MLVTGLLCLPLLLASCAAGNNAASSSSAITDSSIEQTEAGGQAAGSSANANGSGSNSAPAEAGGSVSAGDSVIASGSASTKTPLLADIPLAIPDQNWLNIEQLYQLTHQSPKPAIYDLRDYVHFSNKHLPKAKSLPYRFLDKRFAEIPREKLLVMVCKDTSEALGAFQLLVSNGYDPELLRVIVIDDEMAAWEAAGYPVESKVPSRC